MITNLRSILCLALIVVSSTAVAEDGLVVQLTISKESLDGAEKSRYIDAVLLSYPGTSTIELSGLYEVKFQIDDSEAEELDLVFTLKDVSSGKPYYVGAESLSFKVGESSSVKFGRNGKTYDIVLDTSYGELP